jgi:hypothetical protein
MSGQAWKAGHAVNYGNFKRNSQSTVQRTKQRLLDRNVWFLGLFKETINTGMKSPIITEDTQNVRDANNRNRRHTHTHTHTHTRPQPHYKSMDLTHRKYISYEQTRMIIHECKCRKGINPLRTRRICVI